MSISHQQPTNALPDDDVCRHLIATVYGDRRARRSGVLLLRHIEHGLAVLDALQASTATKQAWCLHPLVQDDTSLLAALSDDSVFRDAAVPVSALLLAMEYRATANAFLSTDMGSPYKRPVDSVVPEVRLMLIADKVQNRSDFERHHKETHPRADELARYFALWLAHLGIDEVRARALAEPADHSPPA